MYADITPAAQRKVSPSRFARDYEADMRTATAEGRQVAGRAHSLGGGRVAVPVRVHTRMWGTLPLQYTIPTVSVGGDTRVAWTRAEGFPGVAPGSTLTRSTTLPRRATLLARDGTVLAESPAEGRLPQHPARRHWPARSSAKSGPIPSSRRHELEAEGVPGDAEVGVSGLERALDDRLRGRPGGELLAGNAVLASAVPQAVAGDPLDDLSGDPAGGRHGSRRPARRGRRDQALQRRGAGRRRARPRRPAAAGLDVQDRHPVGGARGASGHAPHDLPLRQLRDARRRPPQQRQRRELRRLAGTRLRRLLQLGVHAARRQARREPAGGDGRKVRLQPRPGPARRIAQHAPGSLTHPGRTRHRLDGDRTGRGARHAPADGDRRPPRSPTAATGPRPPSRSARHAAARRPSARRSHAPSAT